MSDGLMGRLSRVESGLRRSLPVLPREVAADVVLEARNEIEQLERELREARSLLSAEQRWRREREYEPETLRRIALHLDGVAKAEAIECADVWKADKAHIKFLLRRVMGMSDALEAVNLKLETHYHRL